MISSPTSAATGGFAVAHPSRVAVRERTLSRFVLGLTLCVLCTLARPAVEVLPQRPALWREFLTTPSDESPSAAEFRHQLVAVRRTAPLVLAHRGATAFAPENTLEACAAALDHGADGCEIDLRRTSDGALVLFHDETLDRITDGFGAVDQATFRELENLHPLTAHGRPQAGVPPSFAALLDLARERIMLLHLDLKVPGIEEEVARLLDLADAWDHIVFVNEEHAARLRQNPKLRLLRYKAPGLYLNRLDMDPLAITRALNQSGEMILVGDPRVAAMVLGRNARLALPFSKTYRISARLPEPSESSGPTLFRPLSLVRELEARFERSTPDRLLALLRTAPPDPERTRGREPGGDFRARQIVERAWAAQQAGLRGFRSREALDRLESLVRSPGWHSDHRFIALDGASAARALGRLGAVSSAPVLIDAVQSPFSAVQSLDDTSTGLAKRFASYRMALSCVQALSDLRCRSAKKFLRARVNSNPDHMPAASLALFEEATSALLRQRIAWDEIAALARHKNPAVRGTAILECVDQPGEERLQALRTAAPWATSIARRRPWAGEREGE